MTATMSRGYRRQRRSSTSPSLVCLSRIWLATLLTLSANAFGAQGIETSPGHRVRLTYQRPPCTLPPGMPIVPDDPGALVAHGNTRCYGTHAPELDLYLPDDRYVWLTPDTRNPAVWIKLGGVVVDPAELDPAPLGLRLSVAGDSWNLETRQGRAATMTALEPGVWKQVTAPGDQRFWVLAGDAEPTPARVGHGRIRQAD